MPRRRLVTGILLAAGSLAGSLFVRRRIVQRRERADLYAEDGALLSLGEGMPGAAPLLAVAHEIFEGS